MNWSEVELKIGGAKSALAKYKTASALEIIEHFHTTIITSTTDPHYIQYSMNNISSFSLIN
ncbi:hypothetical protein [uncultured Dysgonomonas sp.]|uniref:Uncharacterized protein n=1 Tax=uncultured Dysgonomonas sp. TaxID=206096 RepID=A0A212K6P9_9BACT|nr:hypothetical protein [uncultured Dysgonomonas sp.]SBW07297.1 hypothetical protein KL86DYS1_31629 [uncultured Dysgonomonas sp.]